MAPTDETYDGPVCFQDGWHYTVVADPEDKALAVAVSEAHLSFAQARGSEEDIAAAQGALDYANTHEYTRPGERLFSDGEGNYRLATDEDTESHNDRFSQKFATIEMEDGTTTRVTPEEFGLVQTLLAEHRKNQEVQ